MTAQCAAVQLGHVNQQLFLRW